MHSFSRDSNSFRPRFGAKQENYSWNQFSNQSNSRPFLSPEEHKSRKDAREVEQFFWEPQNIAIAAFARGHYRPPTKSPWQLAHEQFLLFGSSPTLAAGAATPDAQVDEEEGALVDSLGHVTGGVLSTPGIDFAKYDDIPVDRVSTDPELETIPVIGTRGFEEIFSTFAMPDFVRSNVALLGWAKPTPVQQHAIPAALYGKDLMVCAQTGSGKTCAFLLPIVSILQDDPNALIAPGTSSDAPHSGPAGPRAVILAPTRELCTQIFAEALKLTFRSSFRVVQIYGGAEAKHQLIALSRGVDILIATPGRLIDFIDRGVVTVAHVQILVLDEADKMLDMGFEPQIRNIVQFRDMNPVLRQTLMFSATFPKPIRQLATDFCRPEYIWLAVGRVGGAAETVTQRFVKILPEEKPVVLAALLGGRATNARQVGTPALAAAAEAVIPKSARTLVFVGRKRTASELVEWLWRSWGVRAAEIHGDISQGERERALRMFRQGDVAVLIASDVASRGLDIPDVDHVINYDLPTNIDDYVHRIGRTGRIGRRGAATSFFVSDSDVLPEAAKAGPGAGGNSSLARDLVELLTHAKMEVPEFLLEEINARRFGGSKKHPNAAFKSHQVRPNGSQVAPHRQGPPQSRQRPDDVHPQEERPQPRQPRRMYERRTTQN